MLTCRGSILKWICVETIMWDDEPAAWDVEEPAEAAAEGAAGEGAPAEGAAPEKPALKLEKLEPPHYNHHWVRPLFLNYAYLYDYRWADRTLIKTKINKLNQNILKHRLNQIRNNAKRILCCLNKIE